jgi:hypothetical protein
LNSRRRARLRLLPAAAACIALAAGGRADAVEVAPRGQFACQTESFGNDAMQVSCPLNASGTNRRFRFVARFSGSHDDTIASMTAALDGVPVACDDRSKTSLAGEDGDVSLECGLPAASTGDPARILRVMLKWRHAQYVDFEFAPE